jgi:hypothetical protein
LATALLALACLGACSATPGSQRVADSYAGRQQLIERDVQAILRGMAQVRAENERLEVVRDHAPRQPGS